jgi:carbon monoxide dehydrogenase subunit G
VELGVLPGPGEEVVVSVVQATVEVDAPPERVWEVVANPRDLPRWDHHIEAVDGVPPDGLGPGVEYEAVVKLMGARARIKVTVLEIRPREYAKVRLEGLLNGVVQTWLEPIGKGRTRLKHKVAYKFRGGPFGRLAARGVKALGASVLLRRGAMAQKEQAEEDAG